ncbi:hypothetical protein LTR56_011354 [Elasticomyces elasticus]|nr:hypothetical protein LTR56_011354 [Elasticomyces elasticus]KAK3660956.1 hypothetical protein LTR22_007784 [Elasticomyces elasticus]KAK4932363.1 hypothetical protein LTR49_001232 [Elasticomyces elasticus]KAK5768371.1 hypothetical protein LTS12_001510 [Elasticomyces elasticus]
MAASAMSKLPAELRNRIYTLVLPTKSQEFRFSFTVFAEVPAILQVCRKIRREALGMNSNVNIRIVLDEQQAGYDTFKHRLDRTVLEPYTPSGWFASAESFEAERFPLEDMTSISAGRRAREKCRAVERERTTADDKVTTRALKTVLGIHVSGGVKDDPDVTKVLVRPVGKAVKGVMRVLHVRADSTQR